MLSVKQIVWLTIGFTLWSAVATVGVFADWHWILRTATAIALLFSIWFLLRLIRGRSAEARAKRALAATLVAIAGAAASTSFLSFSLPFGDGLLQFGTSADPVSRICETIVCISALAAAVAIWRAPGSTPGSIIDERWLAQLRSGSRQWIEDSHDAISDEFGISTRVLVGRYVEPDFQPHSPSDDDERSPLAGFRSPVSKQLEAFLNKHHVEKSGENTLFVLSDAGMGKTSLLVMLRLTYLSKKFWPNNITVELMKIGESTIDRMNAIEHKSRTVLLLDSLDEDQSAYGNVERRLTELLASSRPFRQVIISCRTQFFPAGAPSLHETNQFFHFDDYRCYLYYLSPFSDSQVGAYLRRAYPCTPMALIRRLIGRGDLVSRRRFSRIIGPMQSLRMRPMLLANAQLLTLSPVNEWTEFAIYKEMVNEWLRREAVKTQGLRADILRAACRTLAARMQSTGIQHVARETFEEWSRSDSHLSAVRELNFRAATSLLNQTSDKRWRFSHYTIQEFLAAESFLQGSPYLPQPTNQFFRFVAQTACEPDLPDIDKVAAARDVLFPWHLPIVFSLPGPSETVLFTSEEDRVVVVPCVATTIEVFDAESSAPDGATKQEIALETGTEPFLLAVRGTLLWTASLGHSGLFIALVASDRSGRIGSSIEKQRMVQSPRIMWWGFSKEEVRRFDFDEYTDDSLRGAPTKQLLHKTGFAELIHRDGLGVDRIAATNAMIDHLKPGDELFLIKRMPLGSTDMRLSKWLRTGLPPANCEEVAEHWRH